MKNSLFTNLVLVFFLFSCITVWGLTVSDEFQVNTYTVSDQVYPSIAMDSSGDFVITWQSGDLYGGETTAYARKFDSNCNPVVNEFIINYAGYDRFPKISMDGSGNFAIVWWNVDPDDWSEGVYCQIFDSSCNTIKNPFEISSFGETPEIAMDYEGNFVVTWAYLSQGSGDEDTGYDVFGRMYDSNGNAKVSPFQVNVENADHQMNPSIAMDDAGNFVIAWDTGVLTGIDNWDLHAQIYDKNGLPLRRIKINTEPSDVMLNPSVAMDSEGNFVIAWSNMEGYDADIYARRYDKEGETIGSRFRVNTYTAGYQFTPSVAMDSEGNFIVTWKSDGQDGSGYGVFAQRYNSSGIKNGSEFQVNTFTTGDQSIPSAACDDSGDFVIAWASDEQDGDGAGIYARYYKEEAPTFTPTPEITPTPTFTTTPWDAIPILTDGKVVPESGLPGTTFEYRVYYSDLDGGTPAVKNIYINMTPYDMVLKSGNDWDGLYHLEISDVSSGKNNFYFLFADDEGNGVRYPPGGSLDGPYVGVEKTPTPTPTITPTPIPTETPTPEVSVEFGLAISPRQSSFTTGDKFSLLLDIKTSSKPLYADIYWVMVQNFSGNAFFAPVWNDAAAPVLKNINVPPNVDTKGSLLLEVTIPATRPPIGERGVYTFAIGATKPGTANFISNIAVVSYKVE